MKKSLPFIFTFISSISFSQVGINTETPQATLDVVALDNLNKPDGILIPRISRERAQNMNNPVESTLIYINNISNGSLSGKTIKVDEIGFYYFKEDLNIWEKFSNSNIQTPTQQQNFGDIKYSYLANDHNGWVLLNGRNINSFSVSQQQKAIELGFTTSLPDARGNILKMSNNTALALGEISGNNSVTLSRNNLPNITLTGTTNTTGSHTHSYVDRGNNSFNVTSNGSLSPVADDTSGTYTTGASGNHSHTVSVPTGGSGASINVENRYINVNTFIYLGL